MAAQCGGRGSSGEAVVMYVAAEDLPCALLWATAPILGATLRVRLVHVFEDRPSPSIIG